MQSLINSLGRQLHEVLEIGSQTEFSSFKRTIENVVIVGLGGSGIGGTIIAELVSSEIQVPVTVVKDYILPTFVGRHTLVIGSSYSGNTEETLTALNMANESGAEICIITSGGKAREHAQRNNWNHFIVPGGNPPRSMLAYSLVLQLFALRNYELISTDFESPLQAFVSFLEEGQDSIIKESKLLADSLAGKIPVIYSVTGNEGIAIRLRQQLNENSKMLCWHAVIPEMNHNELVGWENGTDQMAVVILRNHSDYSRNQARIEINKEIIHPKSPNIYEVWSKGDSKLEQTLYHIHFGDWLSYHLSEINQVDIMAIDAIDRLKSELSQLD